MQYGRWAVVSGRLCVYCAAMSLLPFHRLLIVTAIAFCFGFAAWLLVTGDGGAWLLAVAFLVAGVVLAYYLARLRHFLGMDDRQD